MIRLLVMVALMGVVSAILWQRQLEAGAVLKERLAASVGARNAEIDGALGRIGSTGDLAAPAASRAPDEPMKWGKAAKVVGVDDVDPAPSASATTPTAIARAAVASWLDADPDARETWDARLRNLAVGLAVAWVIVAGMVLQFGDALVADFVPWARVAHALASTVLLLAVVLGFGASVLLARDLQADLGGTLVIAPAALACGAAAAARLCDFNAPVFRNLFLPSMGLVASLAVPRFFV